ncbi:MAG: aromatic amino acid ammonia-lyase [Solirubrobacteraceae bacterium MAG38_C4-C5]|nr:aromatic amino acid ammonia-lyase [Candidatus Siliceabacter maunaloa]
MPVVRAMMLTRANGMAKAGVGVRRELIEPWWPWPPRSTSCA